jgi:hypothetical protein
VGRRPLWILSLFTWKVTMHVTCDELGKPEFVRRWRLEIEIDVRGEFQYACRSHPYVNDIMVSSSDSVTEKVQKFRLFRLEFDARQLLSQ